MVEGLSKTVGEVSTSHRMDAPKSDAKHASAALYTLLRKQKGKDSKSSAFAEAKHPLVEKTIKKLKKAKNFEEVSVSDLESLNERFMAGHLPRKKAAVPKPESDSDSDDDDDDDDDDDYDDHRDRKKPTGILSKMLVFQMKYFGKVRNYALKYASKTGRSWIRNLIPTNQLVTLATILVYTYVLNVEFLSVFLPLIAFFLAFVVLIIATLRSVRGERRYKEFAAWSNLISSLEIALDVVEAEDNYFKNHVSPLTSMPPGVILTVMSFAVCPQQSMPKGEIALICLGLCIVCFISYKSSLDRLALGSIAFQVLATFLEGFNRFSSAVLQRSLSFSVSDGIMINFNLSVIFRILFLCLLLTLPFQSKYRSLFAGFIRGLVPCLFVSVWWELFSFFFYYSKSSSLIRASVEMAFLCFSIPSAVIMLGYGLIAWIRALSLIKIVIFVFVIAIGFLFIKFRPQGSQLAAIFDISKFSQTVKIIVYVCIGIIGLAALFLYRPSGLQIDNSPLTWNNYYQLCLNNKMNKANNALSHRLCHHLNGHNIHWAGKTLNVQIMSMENKLESVANILPSFLANWMSCTFGEKYPSKEECETSAYSQLLCSMAKHSQRDCHLEAFTKYQFYIMCEMSSKEGETRNIKLLASNRFQEYIFYLRRGVEFSYSGMLNADAETVKLVELQILGTDNIKIRASTEDTIQSMISDSVKTVLRFLFSPFVTIESRVSKNQEL